MVLFELLRTKKGLLYLYVSDFLQKSLTEHHVLKLILTTFTKLIEPGLLHIA